MIKELKDVIKEILEDATQKSTFYQKADKEEGYPYTVFDFRRIGSDYGVDKFILEVNSWDNHETSSRIEKIMDDLETEVHANNIVTEIGSVTIYKGPREPVPDENKDIKRIREQFEMHVVGRRL